MLLCVICVCVQISKEQKCLFAYVLPTGVCNVYSASFIAACIALCVLGKEEMSAARLGKGMEAERERVVEGGVGWVW